MPSNVQPPTAPSYVANARGEERGPTTADADQASPDGAPGGSVEEGGRGRCPGVARARPGRPWRRRGRERGDTLLGLLNSVHGKVSGATGDDVLPCSKIISRVGS